MSAGMKMLGMRPAASGILLTGGALFMTLGLVSCSSNVTRFDYPMFAASEESSDSGLTTASLEPVPTEPAYQGSRNHESARGYTASADQTVVKSELPPPSVRSYDGASNSGRSYRQNRSYQPRAGHTQPPGAQARTARRKAAPAGRERPYGDESYPQQRVA